MTNVQTSVTQLGLARLNEYMEAVSPQQWHPTIIQELIRFAMPVAVVEDDDAELVECPASWTDSAPYEAPPEYEANKQFSDDVDNGIPPNAVAGELVGYHHGPDRLVPIYRLDGETLSDACVRTQKDEKVRRAIGNGNQGYQVGGHPGVPCGASR